jgi:hypothetical protein
VAKLSKEAPKLTTGLPMVNSIALPVENLSTGNSYQLQLMKPFTWSLAIHLPSNFRNFHHPAREFPSFFMQNSVDFKINLMNLKSNTMQTAS